MTQKRTPIRPRNRTAAGRPRRETASVVKVVVSGPVGSGKSALIQEIVVALRAIGVKAEAIGQTPYDTSGDPIASLEIYRDTLQVEVSEDTTRRVPA